MPIPALAALLERSRRFAAGERDAVLDAGAVADAEAVLREVLHGEAPRGEFGDSREVLSALAAACQLYLDRYRVQDEDNEWGDLLTLLALVQVVTAVDPQAVPAGPRGLVGRLAEAQPDDLAQLQRVEAWANAAVDLHDAHPADDPAAWGTARNLLRLVLLALPAGDRRRSIAALNLAGQLLRAVQGGGEVGMLEEAAQVAREAAGAAGRDDPARAGLLSNLALVLGERYERTDDLASLDEAVMVARSAVDAAVDAPGDEDDQALALSNLGLLLRNRAERTGSMTDLDEAIAAGREALAATPGDPRRLSNLGIALRVRFEMTGVADSLAEAVALARDAAAAYRRDHPDYPSVQLNLGAALMSDYGRSGRPDSLSEAVAAFRAAGEALPIGHPTVPGLQSNLGLALQAVGERTGEVGALDEAIGVLGQAVGATAHGHPDRPGYLSNLGNALLARYERTGDPGSLDAAVQAGRAAVDATPPDHPDRASYLSNLAIGLRSRSERTGDLASLDEAVEACRRAISATPPGHPDWAVHLTNLSAALLARAERTGSRDDLEDSVTTGRDAVAATPPGHVGLAARASNLTLALHARYERTGDVASLVEAVQVGRRAVAATPAGHVDLAGRLSNLALAQRVLFERTGDLGDLDRAVDAARAAVAATPPDHPDRAGYLSNLGNALLARYERTGDAAGLTAALDAGRQARDATPPDHPARAGRLSNLGNALQAHYDRTGDLAALEEAVAVSRQAVEATPNGDPDRARYLANLAATLHARYEHTGALASLEAAVEASEAAVAALPDDHPSRPVALFGLGNSLQSLGERTGDPAALDGAVAAGRTATATLPDDHPARALLLGGLANALQLRHARAGELSDLRDAVVAARGAVDLTPPGQPDRVGRLSNLAIALLTLYQRAGDRVALGEAVAAAQAASAAVPADHPDRAITLFVLGEALETTLNEVTDLTTRDGRDQVARTLDAFRRAARSATGAPTVRVRAAAAWGRLAAATGDPRDGHEGLATAVELLERVAPRALDREDQEYQLAQFSGIASDAAACAVQRGDLPGAVALLEQGRAILLARSLLARTESNGLAELRRREPALAQRFEELRAALDRGAHPRATLPPRLVGRVVPADRGILAGGSSVAAAALQAEQRQALASELEALISRIRQRPSFEGFLRLPDPDTMLDRAEAGPLVLVNVSGLGSQALLVTADGIDQVELARVTPRAVQEQVGRFQRALDTLHGTDRPDEPGRPLTDEERNRAEARLRDVLAWLWDAVAEPVLNRLGFHRPPGPGVPWPRLWWSATGPLAMLPLHAAGRHDRTSPTSAAGTTAATAMTVIDRVIPSYTPTIGARAHALRDRTARGDGQEQGAPTRRVLVVSIASTPRQRDLPAAGREADLLHRLFPGATTPLIGAQATSRTVLGRLPGHVWAHFACHGYADPARPSASQLLTHDYLDEPLTVAEISRLWLADAELAFLSACDTARTGPALVDEAIHLASAFQLAGYRHVIGTLWPVADRHALRFAEDVYVLVRAQGTADAAPYALHAAVRRRRDRWRDRPSVWAAHVHAGAGTALPANATGRADQDRHDRELVVMDQAMREEAADALEWVTEPRRTATQWREVDRLLDRLEQAIAADDEAALRDTVAALDDGALRLGTKLGDTVDAEPAAPKVRERVNRLRDRLLPAGVPNREPVRQPDDDRRRLGADGRDDE